MGRNSAVDIATCYSVDGSVIESQWGARFSTPVQTGPGAHPASCKVVTGSFLGIKRQGHGGDHPPPSNAEVKERVELYIYSPSRPDLYLLIMWVQITPSMMPQSYKMSSICAWPPYIKPKAITQQIRCFLFGD